MFIAFKFNFLTIDSFLSVWVQTLNHFTNNSFCTLTICLMPYNRK